MNLLQKTKEEMNKLKHESNKDSEFDMNSIISLEKQVAELTKELEMTYQENNRLKRASKNFEAQVDQYKNSSVQYMNLSKEEDLITILKLNQKQEKQLGLKDEEIEELNSTFKSLLKNEKQKFKNLKNKFTGLRGKYEEKKGKFLQMIANKDDEIERIKKKSKNLGSPSANIPGLKYNRNSDLDNLSLAEYTLLRM